jgi:hypothetical protein
MTSRLSSARPLLCALALAAGLAALIPTACFSLREPPCAFSCLVPPHRCPEKYTCGDDGLCHRAGAEGICTLVSPADAGAGDRDRDGAAGDQVPTAEAGTDAGN